MWSKDSLLCIKRDVGVSTVHLEQVEVGDEKEEEEEVNFLTKDNKPRLERGSCRLVHKIAKEKAHAHDRVPRKRKFLADAIPAAKKANIHFELISVLKSILVYECLQLLLLILIRLFLLKKKVIGS